jgi:hypothetical protein
MKTDLSKRMDWASASIGPTREVLDPVVKTLYDLPPPGSTEGAREVAQLAAWRAAQEFAFQPVMEALTKLRDRVWDPEQPFLLADSVDFSWKTGRVRRYASFEDFYQRELESTWGKWSDLQETWKKVAKGELTDEQGKAQVMANAQPMPEQEIGIEGGKAGPGRGKKTADDVSRFTHGNSTSYLAARLKRDAPEIAARIDDFPSIRAAALAAGIIRKRTPLELLEAAWRKASEAERAAFLRKVVH